MLSPQKLFLLIVLVALVEVSSVKNRRIIIVGAGLAGFSAAAKLIENGYTNIIILEALDRKGGRIHTIDYGAKGQKLDLGAQWVHGETGNIIWEMVKDHVELGSSPFESVDRTYLFSNGTLANQKDCLKVQKLIDKTLDGSWFEAKRFNGPFGSFFIDKFSKSLTKPAFKNITKELMMMMQEDVAHKRIQEFYGCFSWFDFSAQLNADYELAGGDQDVTWRDKGYATVFDYISKKLPKRSQFLNVDSKIRYKKEVINILHSRNPRVASLVTCADGSSFKADNVIVTVSLGVLKLRHKTLFTPNLPPRKMAAIQSLGFGTLGKIFLKFDNPFWSLDESEFLSYAFLWREEDKKSIRGTDKEWLLGIVSFTVVDAFPELIEALFAGPMMPIFETISDQKLIADTMWFLEKFLGRKLPLPSYMNRTKWLTNKYFLGSYSFISYASEKRKVVPADLAAPIIKTNGKKFLHFAGEATDIEYPSYAHGAVLSGYRAANEIIHL